RSIPTRRSGTRAAAIPEKLRTRPTLRGYANTPCSATPQAARGLPKYPFDRRAARRLRSSAISSAVTSRTVGDRLRGLDVVLLHQPLSFPPLVVTRRRPLHVEDLLTRPDIFRRIAVAFQTPFHVQRRDTPGERHPIHASVAGRTADAFPHVDAVVEIDVILQVFDNRPFNPLGG